MISNLTDIERLINHDDGIAIKNELGEIAHTIDVMYNPRLADCTDVEFVSVVKQMRSGKISCPWVVGDTRVIHISESTYFPEQYTEIQVLDKNPGYKFDDGTDVNVIFGVGPTRQGTLNVSNMPTVIYRATNFPNNQLYPYMPEYITGVMKQMKVLCNGTEYAGYMPMISLMEINGEKSGWNNDGSLLEYFKASANRQFAPYIAVRNIPTAGGVNLSYYNPSSGVVYGIQNNTQISDSILLYFIFGL